MAIFLVLLALASGFALGRVYQWLRHELLSGFIVDRPIIIAHRATSEISAHKRQAEEQVRRLVQP